jgi:hypothetical protein
VAQETLICAITERYARIEALPDDLTDRYMKSGVGNPA